MGNRNHRYQNGIAKRDAVRAMRAALRGAGCLDPQREAEVTTRLGHAPRFLIDTNLMFAILGYWEAETRRAIVELANAQPALRLFILDVVASEIRGSGTTYRRRLQDAIVYNGSNPDVGVIRPLVSDTGKVGATLSRILASRSEHEGEPSPSDRKDALIAAAAIAYDMVVLTRNGKDFAAIAAREPGLRYAVIEGGEQADLRLGALILERLAAGFRRA